MSNIEFQGLEEVLQAMDEVAETSGVEGAIGKACLIVERAAKQNAPKGNGDLRNSIQSKVETRNGDVVGVVFTPLGYAPYVEYGTGLFAESGGRKDVPWHYKDDEGEWHSTNGMHPHPFMRPAFNDNRERILKIIEESVKNG